MKVQILGKIISVNLQFELSLKLTTKTDGIMQCSKIQVDLEGNGTFISSHKPNEDWLCCFSHHWNVGVEKAQELVSVNSSKKVSM